MKYAGDPSGPFAGGRPLRIFLDLPPDAREPDAVSADGMTVPNRDHMLWTQCQRDDIQAFWFAHDGADPVEGAVLLGEVDRSVDMRMFRVRRQDGAWMQGVHFYGKLEQAARSGRASLEVLTKAAVADELRVDLLVTNDPALLALTGSYERRVNVMSTTEALAVVGLFLREGEYYEQRLGKLNFRTSFDALSWSALRSQLPASWPWSGALLDHDSRTEGDAGMIFDSLFERLARALNQRDDLHRTMSLPASNRSRKQMVETFDYIMMNLVGAFDAVARSAHLGAGLPWSNRAQAKWQNPKWRDQLGVPELDAMFDREQPAADLFYVLRQLRNTIHGAGLSSTTSSSVGKDPEVLAMLPRDDAAEILNCLDRLNPQEDWGMNPTSSRGATFHAARLTEALLPRALATMNNVLELCPIGALQGDNAQLLLGSDRSTPHDIGTRTRACLLYGLPVPTV